MIGVLDCSVDLRPGGCVNFRTDPGTRSYSYVPAVDPMDPMFVRACLCSSHTRTHSRHVFSVVRAL